MMSNEDEDIKDADTDVSKHVDDAFEAEYEDDEEEAEAHGNGFDDDHE